MSDHTCFILWVYFRMQMSFMLKPEKHSWIIEWLHTPTQFNQFNFPMVKSKSPLDLFFYTLEDIPPY